MFTGIASSVEAERPPVESPGNLPGTGTLNIETRKSQDRLRLLLEVSESIASYRDVGELFRVLGARLPRLVPFDFLNLVLHDPVRDVMRLHILTTDAPSTITPGLELPVDESPAGLVWKTQQPLMIRDLALEQRFPVLTPRLLENDVRSYCAVPLTTALRRLGALGFGSMQPNAYSEADLEFMQHVAKQVAVAVDNILHDESARLAQQQLARERDRLRVRLEINNAVVAHLDLDDMFAAIAASLASVIQHDGCALVVYDADMRRYRCLLQKSNGEHANEEGTTETDQLCGPSMIALDTRSPVVLSLQDLQRLTSSSPLAQRLLEKGVRSFCSVPLFSRDRTLGTLNLGRFQEAAFTPDDVDLLTDVGRQVSIAVENGLAYQQIAELKEKLNTEKLYLEDEIRTNFNFGEIIGESPALRQVLKQVEIVAPTDSTVLIQGETGTGKELIARAIHTLSGRRARTFVKINCAAIPTGLLESELFGHEKGAFTGAIAQKVGRFELAQGGTLFLDEVGDIPLELQSKFLRVLQEQEFERLGGTRTIRVDIRLVAATNRDLQTMVDDRAFRSDLFYRLNVFPIVNPPLRNRADDIPQLVRYFTRKFATRMNKTISSIPTAVMDALSRYHWPGNVRELENFIERAVILSRASSLDAPLADLKARTIAAPVEPASSVELSTLEDAERDHIRRVLEQTNWLVGGPTGAAVRLGMKRTTLQSKMERLGIARPR